MMRLRQVKNTLEVLPVAAGFRANMAERDMKRQLMLGRSGTSPNLYKASRNLERTSKGLAPFA